MSRPEVDTKLDMEQTEELAGHIRLAQNIQKAHTHLNASVPELSDEFESLFQQVLLSRRHHDLDLCGTNLLC